jgi:hypothetical protein
MPIVLNPVDDNLLTKFFSGTQLSQEEGAAPQFGCSQVVIVRDQE